MSQNSSDKRDHVVSRFLNLGLTDVLAKDLEIGIFNESIDYCKKNNIVFSWSSPGFDQVYCANVRRVFTNLNPKSYVENHRLWTRLSEGEMLPHEIASMKREELYPERWKHIMDRALVKLKNAYEFQAVAMTDQYTCSKCKKKKISYYELQTRSADEPSTHFFTCLNCGHRWKM
jgi:transcription elongation factor S-II